MPILNYTTEVPVEKTISEIEKILSEHGATDILKSYNGGIVAGLSFVLDVNNDGKKIPFKMPLDMRAWVALLNQAVDSKGKSGKRLLPLRYKDDEAQAARVGWRVIKDWVAAQMALVETRTVKIEQVFLPYVYDYGTGKTLYEKFVENRSKFIALQAPEEK